MRLTPRTVRFVPGQLPLMRHSLAAGGEPCLGRASFAPSSLSKPRVPMICFLGWSGLFVFAIVRDRESGTGVSKAPESNLVVVAAFALALLAIRGLLLSTRFREAVVREGTDREPYRLHTGLIAGRSSRACRRLLNSGLLREHPGCRSGVGHRHLTHRFSGLACARRWTLLARCP